ncbi:hypothetical protein K458DRAFT_427803 [Lentithecium fluviatile CBS 122367]|uniref:SMP-30/Gluconolactonase/LRE-like region domain-containing protein n=1 Tax=Lentithecium fluviatile CBS 122367 TaxID=1168545 RepID=A0A6G1JGJ2_9PLEO|nr:hypothetical protein K458DRAFT_427803 [Lentithecium fluviatile CBS 122367]
MLSPKALPFFLGPLAAATQLPLPRTIHQFPNPTWLENIASTRNGTLLTGVLGATAALHLIDPFASDSAPVDSLLYDFPSANSVFGISELSPNIFAVATGNYSTTSGATEGTSSLWTVGLNSLEKEDGTPAVRKVVDLKDTSLVNGIAALNKDTVLVADSLAGTILGVSVKTGEYHVLHDDISLAPNLTASPAIGVNGLKYLAPNLYFTSTRLGAFRVRVDPDTGAAVGPYVKLASLEVPDDLAVTDDGTVFVARPLGDVVEKVGVDGDVTVIAGGAGEEVVRGATAVTLGRTWRDRGVVYVCTMGGFAEDGSFVEGGKIVAVSMD